MKDNFNAIQASLEKNAIDLGSVLPYINLAKGTASAIMRAEGKKQRNKDKDLKGADDQRATILLVGANVLDAIDLTTITTESLSNLASALEAAAVEVRAAIPSQE